jgi:tRNA threonylcarbamoyladenosine biosynthesis protein TsaB
MSGVSEVAAVPAKPTILAIDTSTERLGVALLHGEACAYRHLQLGTGHANQVLGLVEELLQECGVARAALDAIAVCRGPGGFTGLRIATSVAQGLALALDRPVVPVSGLRVLAAAATGPAPVVAVIDARMGEFYAAAWKDAAAAWAGAAPLFPEALLKPDALKVQVGQLAELTGGVVDQEVGQFVGHFVGQFVGQFVGPGVTALSAVEPAWPGSCVLAWPDARVLAFLGRQGLLAGEGVPAEAAQPVYLRDQVAVPSVARVV